MAVTIASAYSVVEFTVPGATEGITPTDINNTGEIVGFYSNGNRTASGLISQFGYDSTGNPEVSFTSVVNDPVATSTEAYGVDDGGTIVGAIAGRSGALGTEGFTDADGGFTTVTAPARPTPSFME